MAGKVTQANLAGISKRIPNKMGAFSWALIATSAALVMIPGLSVIGAIPAHFVDRFRHNMESKTEKKALTDWYRHQIAGQLQIPADEVTYRDLNLAAEVNPTFKAMIDKIDTEKAQDDKSSLIANGFAAVVPGGGLVKVGVQMGGSMTPFIFAKDKIFVDDVVNHIHEKRQGGQQVELGDVFMLRLAHNEALQDQIEQQHGAKFQKMTPEQQQAVMQQMPDMMQASQREAYAVNQGLVSEQDLAVASSSAPQASFTNQAQPRAGSQSSFRAREDARRAQAAQMQQQLA